jgi:predicted N-acetyltransferase YhbS
MAYRYTSKKKLSVQELAELFSKSGIQRPLKNPARLKKMLKHANLIVTAWDEEKRLVGVARALTDFAWCCYLSDLAVDKAHQKKGVGKELVRQVKKAVGKGAVLVLLAAPEAQSYYPRIGFERALNGWKIPRKF